MSKSERELNSSVILRVERHDGKVGRQSGAGLYVHPESSGVRFRQSVATQTSAATQNKTVCHSILIPNFSLGIVTLILFGWWSLFKPSPKLQKHKSKQNVCLL